MSEELQVLKDVAEILNAAGIDYMVSGSVAMNFYAQPRMTRDIDIVLALRKKGTKKFVSLFKNEFYLDEDVVEDEVRQNGMFNLIHNKYVIKVDFILQKNAAYDNEAFARRRQVKIDGADIWIISPEDLILAKLRWARDSLSEMQIKDVRNIICMVSYLDEKYIENWTAKLDLKNILEKAKP